MADEKKDEHALDPKPAPDMKASDADKIAALEARLEKAEQALKSSKPAKADKRADDGDLERLSAAELTAATEEVRALRTEIAELKSGGGMKGKRGLFAGVFG